MCMAWAGAMPKPLLAIFSISTVFRPSAEQERLPHACSGSPTPGSRDVRGHTMLWGPSQDNHSCSIVLTCCSGQHSHSLTGIVQAHAHHTAMSLHEIGECHRGALAASPPWW